MGITLNLMLTLKKYKFLKSHIFHAVKKDLEKDYENNVFKQSNYVPII